MVILLRRLILNIVILLVILRHQPQGINEAGNEVVVSKKILLSGKDINTDGLWKRPAAKSFRLFLCWLFNR